MFTTLSYRVLKYISLYRDFNIYTKLKQKLKKKIKNFIIQLLTEEL